MNTVKPNFSTKYSQLKGDDITNYINEEHSCQEFSLFQIQSLGGYISVGPIT